MNGFEKVKERVGIKVVFMRQSLRRKENEKVEEIEGKEKTRIGDRSEERKMIGRKRERENVILICSWLG